MLARRDWWIVVALVGCLGWAGVEVRHLGTVRSAADPCEARAPDAAVVERSFVPVLAQIEKGDREGALLALRDRAQRGPYPGYARFWLGELAYGEKAFEAAVDHYRRAVDAQPALTDHGAAFDAARVLTDRLQKLREGPWAHDAPPELHDLYYLQRRLAGGCG